MAAEREDAEERRRMIAEAMASSQLVERDGCEHRLVTLPEPEPRERPSRLPVVRHTPAAAHALRV